jgi:Carboxypeptidase regulatory-like domain/TonB dependent receptor
MQAIETTILFAEELSVTRAPVMSAVRPSFLLFVLFLGCALPLSAQVNATGTFLGQVTDPTGAAFANAQVKVVEQQTGISVTKLSNVDGYYSVPLLKPGIYSVQVSAPGFAPMIRKNLVLQIQQTIRQDFTLQIGGVRQEVTVTGEAPLLNTESGEIGSVIPRKTLEQLPLNGRNFSQLGFLVPGTNPGPVGGIRGETNGQGNGNETQRAGAEIVADGGRSSFDLFMIDGIDDRDQSVGTVKVFPNLESIQEFQVQTGNYDAEFASGGAVVNVLTRSGSNQFHGSAFEFLRNAALDARQFFDAKKPQFQQNQFGFAIGGPIRKDKTFIFGDYQGLRIHTATTSILTVPTSLMRTGNFSELLGLSKPITIHDPTTGQQLTCNGIANAICPNRIDTVAKDLLALFPLPNIPGAGVVNNLRINPLQANAQDQFDVRVDQVFSQRDTLFARYTYGRANITYPATPLFLNGAINSLAFAQGSGIAGSLTVNHAPSQQATLQEAHQFTPALSNQLALGYTRLELRVIPLAESANIANQLGVLGANVGPDSGGMASLTIAGQSGYNQSSLPEIIPENTYQISDTAFYTRGAHLMHFGFSAIQNRFGFFQLGNPTGALTFNGQYTSNGQPNTGYGFADVLLGLPNSASKSFFIQNKTPYVPYVRYSEYGAFVQDQWHATRRLTVSLGLRYDLFTPPTERHDRQSDFLISTGNILLAGQNGVPPSIVRTRKHDFSPRIGLTYRLNDKTVIRSAYGLYYFNEQGIGGSTRLFINFPFAQQFTVTCAPPVQCLSTGTAILSATTSSQQSVPNVVFQPLANLTPNIQQWHLTIERQLSPTLMIRAAYVGNHGDHLNLNINENNVPFPGPGVTPIHPFPTVAVINGWEPRGISNYHALQLSAEKRHSHGFSFLAAYTWSKSLDEGSGGNSSTGESRLNLQNPHNVRANYGRSSFDYRHRFTLSTIYELPFGRRRRFMNDAGGFAETVAGGWQLASIVTAQSGAPFSVFLNGLGPTSGTFTRPNRLCNGNLASDKRSTHEWFDIACFEAPLPGSFGNAGRNILTGPGLFTWDLGLDKDFPIHERFGIQFRSEFFNLLNRPNFGLPNANIGAAAAGTITTVVTNARQIQFALRLHW